MNDESVNLVDKGIDAAETEGAVQRRRTVRRVAVAGVAVAALVGGGLAIAQPWSGDDGDGADEPSATSAAPPDDVNVASGELPFVVLDGIPDGFVLQWASGPVGDGGGPWVDDLSGVEQTVLLVAAPGATFTDGPWVSVSVQLLDRFERASFDPGDYMSAGDGPAATVRVGAYRGAMADSWWGDGGATLLFGPVNDGFAVSVSGLGVEDDDLVRLAAEITLEEHGDMADAVLGPAAADLGLEVLAAYTEVTYGVGGGPSVPLLSGSPQSLDASWWDGNDGERAISLTVQPAGEGMELGVLGRFFLGDAQDVEVGQWAGVAGDFDMFGQSGSAVVWRVEGATVMLAGSLPVEEMVAIAATARVTDATEWAALVDEANSNGGFEPVPDVPTWLIGAGDFDDGTTWVVEGALDENGRLMLCSASVSAFNSWSTCGGTQEVEVPTLLTTGSFDVTDAVAIVGLAAPDVEAVLRFTADDGTVSEAPVASVREDWPFLVAVLAVTSTGTAELVAADGTVLTTREITETDLVLGGVDIGVATTVAAG